ncbi:MAG: hypothetical protein ACRDV0_07560 [Acidimicrobiales bacterium]
MNAVLRDSRAIDAVDWNAVGAALDADGVASVRHGQRVTLDATDDEVAGFDAGGDLVAVLTRHGGDYQPTLVLSGVGDARG